MAGLARRLAPAAALGGLAVVIVGVADPAIAAWRAQDAVGAQPEAAAAASAQDTATTDTATTESAPQDSATTDTAPQATTDPSSCDSGETVTGDTVMTRWGPVQVAATVAGGRICEVHAVTWPTGDGKSQMINAYAIPQLDQMATQSQGTQLDYISGATYTSDGYAQSLQSILDAL